MEASCGDTYLWEAADYVQPYVEYTMVHESHLGDVVDDVLMEVE